MKRFAMFVVFVFSMVFATATARADSINLGDSLAGWTQDRTLPKTFAINGTQFPGNNVLQLTAGNAASVPFYGYQGMQHALSVDGDVQKLSVDQYVVADANQPVNAGIWGVGVDSSNTASAYPIIAFRRDGAVAAGFYGWYGSAGSWKLLAGASANTWNKLDIVFTKGVGFDYLINDTKYGSYASPSTVGLSAVILNSYSFSASQDQTTYYDNLGATAVPLPASVWGGLALLGVVGAYRFKSKFMRVRVAS